MIKVTAATLAAEPFMRGMRPVHLERLAQTASDIVLPARHRIFEEGGYATGFWLIRRGSIALDLEVPGRGLVGVDTMGMGDMVGWSWLFPPYRWTLGAVTVGQAEAFEFDGAAVRAFLDDDPELGHEVTRRFLAVVASRLRATRLRLLDLQGRSQARAS